MPFWYLRKKKGSMPTWEWKQQTPIHIQFQVAQTLTAMLGKVLNRIELALSIAVEFHRRPRCLHQLLECCTCQHEMTALTGIKPRDDVNLQVVWKEKEQRHSSLCKGAPCSIIQFCLSVPLPRFSPKGPCDSSGASLEVTLMALHLLIYEPHLFILNNEASPYFCA